MMKVSFGTLEHYGFVIAMAAFACMAYSDYSRDGDSISLALAAALIVLAVLATYFRSFHKWKEDEDE